MKTTLISALAVASVLAMMAGPAQKAAAVDTEPRACLDLMRIDHTSVVDDQNILFYTHGGGIYLNHLSHRAPGLDMNRPFMYRTSLSRLCQHDVITVLEDHFFGFFEGASTTLGKFEPIDEARAQALKSGEATAVEEEQPVQTK